MKRLKGRAASPGIAFAKAYHVAVPDLSFDTRTSTHLEHEIHRLADAFQASRQELLQLREEAERGMKKEATAIFDVHLLILNDYELIEGINRKIRKDALTAEAALELVTASFIKQFETMENPYMKERIADIQDVLKRVLSHLLQRSAVPFSQIDEEMILIAHDLPPSTVAQLSNDFVKGIITEVGGVHSHSAIIARSLEIPFVTGVSNIATEIDSKDPVLIDGDAGTVVIHPDEAEITAYKKRRSDVQHEKGVSNNGVNEQLYTKDNKEIHLAANISFTEDITRAKEAGAQAVGLYRTEFLYMDRPALPTEKEQYDIYARVLTEMGDCPVVIRTLDIGADKMLHALPFPEQTNPALGLQSIRFCLENEDIFRPQLRALLRASVHGDLKIMFPMVATLEDVREAKALVFEAKRALEKENISVSDAIEIGVMIEVPSAAMIARQLAKEVDFFSIGTNDLIQYTMAADRLNDQVAATYQPYHPAVLALIDRSVQAAKNEGIKIQVCGEMAADPIGRLILLALGVRHFSMDPSFLLQSQVQLKNLSIAQLASYKDELLQMGTAEEVVTCINSLGLMG